MSLSVPGQEPGGSRASGEGRAQSSALLRFSGLFLVYLLAFVRGGVTELFRSRFTGQGRAAGTQISTTSHPWPLFFHFQSVGSERVGSPGPAPELFPERVKPPE